jgi:hypothetical protein
MLACLECEEDLRVGPEGLEMRRPESGFESSGRMRVFAADSSSPAPQLGHERLSSAITDVHSGHFMARRIVTFKVRAGPSESFRRRTRTRPVRRVKLVDTARAPLLTSAAETDDRTAGRTRARP